jgi:hypothetical protein
MFSPRFLAKVFINQSIDPWSRSYDFLLYSYNASAVVGKLEQFSEKKVSLKTR